MDFLEEMEWRGMIHNSTPELEELFSSGMVRAYVGIDPTAPSMQIGNLVPYIMLMHLQKAGYQPIILVGGATGRVGDPSGKKQERTLLDEETLERNVDNQTRQLQRFFDFDSEENGAIMVNNYDWFKDIKLLDFLRDTGKHFTISYMLAKDSVSSRMESGISFTEFSYQLIQGYDFKWLFENHACQLQMGGSDQWGNMTAGIELIRRTSGKKAHAITCPLITKADGSKFGKTDGGQSIWLDPEMTSPYRFYQFWINTSDEDAHLFIRRLTFVGKEEILALEKEHEESPHRRIMQHRLAKELTVMVHGEEAYQTAVNSSEILFGKGTKETLMGLSANEISDVFEGVPEHCIDKTDLEKGIDILDFLAVSTNIYNSKGEARRSIQGNAVSINKEKEKNLERLITSEDLLNDKFIIIQKGKKNYHLVMV